MHAQARSTRSLPHDRQSSRPKSKRGLSINWRHLEMAEAALGGGMSVALRPRSGIAVRAFADEQEAINEPSLSSDRVLEAERNVRLFVGELLEIEIRAGAADKRRAVESLRTRWRLEGVPALERAGRKSVADIASAISALAKEREDAAELRKAAERLRADAKALGDQAALNDDQAAKLAANVADLDARKAAIGSADVRILEAHFAKLGKTWESQGEALHDARSKAQKTLQAQVTTSAQAAKLAEYRVCEADKRAEELSAAREKAFALPECQDPDALLKAIGDELKSLSQSETENSAQLKSLAAEASSEVEAAAAALVSGRESVHSAKEAHTRRVSALDATRAELYERMGQYSTLSAQLEDMDRAAAADLVKQSGNALSALPNELPVSEADVRAAEQELSDANRELEDAKEDLHKAEGALSKVGGTAVREEVERVEEALAASLAREKEVEVDADAWKLLLETLRDIENDEGAHLGRALAGPITRKFVELTGGRYKSLRLDTDLKAEAVEVTAVASAVDVLEGLSVGTRDQLATLIRLTIADQLKSALVLDDHLVHTDSVRLAWFRNVLMKTALNTQVIVLTCRPEDYLTKEEFPAGVAMRDIAGGIVRAVDVARAMKRWAVAPSRPAPATERDAQHP